AWPGNFRDFSGSLRRLCTLAPRGRITRAMVRDEIETLRRDWSTSLADPDARLIEGVMGKAAQDVDPFDVVQLAKVIRTCRTSATLSAAGRTLFGVSRQKRKTQNDSDRLRKYLQKFDLDWDSVSASPID
ncbi:MAG: sigma 54-dependent transcriptional regulator, partial [Paracoccaceae bacterium]